MNKKNEYYPLGVGFEWKYKSKDGSFYTNKIVGLNNYKENEFIMVNSIMQKNQIICKKQDLYLTDSFEGGTKNVLLKENAAINDSWEIHFKANNFDNILLMTVKEISLTKTINDKTFDNVMMMEAESKIVINGNITPLNFFTQYYYSKGIGLILTTSSMGDEQSLVEYNFT